ncbi:DNA replication regulator DPB11 [Cryptococcus bacillisporus CA1873]|uniref:DNA replication regulator DPB11 n=1 Tax=Cryptococcus bacillisporus CA1873 TaxID=1296111 RepID=A0ABR5B4W9_CRYGA|nr:DNA replication regulator DPB11 [Cryptococcus bacillisporus CA1873]|eukprot:KIR58622.1 DNA replication regulator DPB11 [Cryptococcus gattii CA1873]
MSSRRGHLSRKIPKAINRPAPPKARIPREQSPLSRMDLELLRQAEADDEREWNILHQSAKPWKGVFITFTGVENKAQLSRLARELGAEVDTALTRSITHVVAVSYESPKYQFALANGIPVMTPAWITEAHAIWLAGEELNFEEDEENHRLLPFTGFRISMSGIDQMDRRRFLIQLITNNGGDYSKDLDRDCTHLVSAHPTSDKRRSEKVKWALRENAENEARRRKGVRDERDILIVYEEWIWDCVAYRGRWPSDKYDATKPRRGGKVDPEEVINGTFQIPRPDRKVVINSSTATGGELDTSEQASVRRRKVTGLDTLVGQIIGEGKSRDAPERGAPSEVLEEPAAKRPQPVAKSSMVHLPRSTSFTTADVPTLARSTTNDTEDIAKADESKYVARIFEGLRMAVCKSKGWEAMLEALSSRGAILVDEKDWMKGETCNYAIIRLANPNIPPMPEGQSTIYVTENWVESCIVEGKLVSPDDHLLYKPLTIDVPIPGFEIRLIVDRDVTHLVSFRNHGIKIRRAKAWGSQIVTHDWLLKMAETGKLEPVEGYRLHIPPENLRGSRSKLLTREFCILCGKVNNSMTDLSVLNDSRVEHRFERSTSDQNQQITTATGPSSIPASRALRPTPTHVNDSTDDISMLDARTDVSEIQHADVTMEERSDPVKPSPQSLNRHISAPAPRSSPLNNKFLTETNTNTNMTPGNSAAGASTSALPNKAASAAALEDMDRKQDISDVLRRLAEKPSGTPVSLPRRGRPSARIKNANSRSPAILSPSNPHNPQPLHSNYQESMEVEDDPMKNFKNDVPEESMQIKYVDQKAVRERRKLMALFGEEGESSKKKKR